MLVCVDGTGATETAEYARDFAHSFVNRIKHQYLRANPPPAPRPIHHRGPGLDALFGSFGGSRHVDPTFVVNEIMAIHRRLGDEVEAIPSWALRQPHHTWPREDVEALQSIQHRRKLYMTGHSRGGAIVINVARLLARRGIEVEAMFLFDAVARNLALDAEVIPANVRHCYHAVRDPRAYSRESFSNCGMTAANPEALKIRHFLTTHGGMGGCPFGPGADHTTFGLIDEGGIDFITSLTPALEAEGSAAVERWMWPKLRRFGVVD